MLSFLIELLIAIGLGQTSPAPTSPAAAAGSELARAAAAVESAESSGGTDKRMWRPNPAGPQGPMQVSLAAASDAGGGDRFDPAENRRIGRAYLALMFQRYGNWPDAVAAYAWGPANFDRWVASGRPASGLSLTIRAYLDRIMRQVGTTNGQTAPAPTPASVPVAVRIPLEPPRVGINNPALRKTYRENVAAIAEMRSFLAYNGAPGNPAILKGVQATIKRIASRRGYEEFAELPSVRRQATPTKNGLNSIAIMLIDKLQAQSDAIMLVDDRQKARLQPIVAQPPSSATR
jgi:hypothetical protein